MFSVYYAVDAAIGSLFREPTLEYIFFFEGRISFLLRNFTKKVAFSLEARSTIV